MPYDAKEQTLDLLASGEFTRRQAAEYMRVSTRTINRWMKAAGIVRPTKSKEARERKEKRLEAIKAAKVLPPQKTAEMAGVSVRTAYRWKNL